MKKLINVFLCTLCTVAFFSCEKEIQTPASPEEQIVPEGYELLTFTAVNEQIVSRTSLSDGHTYWSEGDAIKVICSDGTAANASLTAGAGTATGTFAGMVPAGKTPLYAVYPAAAYASLDGSTVNVTVAAEQAGTFAAGNIAVAKINAESHSMSFKNVNSLLVFQLKAGSEVTKVEVTSVDGTALAGTVPVDCSGENPVPGTPASTASTVSMTTNGAGTYYLSIVEPEANHAKGLTMTYYTGSGPYSKTGEYYLNKDLPIVANNMYQFGEVETDGNYYVTIAGAGNHSGMNWANAFSKEEMWKRLTLTAAQQLDPAEDPYFENIYKMEVSSHFLIRRTGEIIQYVSLFSRAWHAGKSYFDGRENCNDFSIGIELEGTDTDPYTDNQYSSLITLTEAIRSKFPRITKKRITGHCNIAPERKTDPGESFNWNFYLNHLSN